MEKKVSIRSIVALICLSVLPFSSLAQSAEEVQHCLSTDECRIMTAPCDFKESAKQLLKDAQGNPTQYEALGQTSPKKLTTWEELFRDEISLYLNQGFCLDGKLDKTESGSCLFHFYRDPQMCTWLGM